jgi:hypothetical protein
MNPLIGIELVKQMFKFGGSFRKEAIGIGTVVPAIVSILNTHDTAGSFVAVTNDQWGFLIGSVIAMGVHLHAKNNEAK